MYALQVNLYSAFILLIVIISLKNEDKTHPYNSKWFGYLIMVNLSLLLIDTVAVLIDGNSQTGWILLNYVSNASMFLIAPLIPLFWYFHTLQFVQKKRLFVSKAQRLLFFPVIVNGVLALLSFVNMGIFLITPDGYYERTTLFFVYVFIMYSYLVFATYNVIVHKKKLKKNEFYPMLIFMIFPAVGGILQVLFYGLLLTWPMTTLSVLMVFVLVQAEKASTDYLTGLFNRRAFESHMQSLDGSKNLNHRIAGAMIDLNNFKNINDTYGHHIGDTVLIETAKTLKKAFEPSAFIARLGGDEFAIIFEAVSEEEYQNKIKHFNQRMLKLNESLIFPFPITYSLGADCYVEERYETVKDFMEHLDDLMYMSKTNNQNIQVEKID